MQKIALLAAVVLATVATPAPASAAAPTVVGVLTAPCAGGLLTAGSTHAAKGGDGRVRGFTSFQYGAACGDRITFFEGAGSSWTARQTSLYGRVVDVAADSTGTYLLYLDTRPARRGPALTVVTRLNDGAFTTPHRLADLAVLAPENAGRGTIIAGNGRWYAVWPQTSATAGQTVLYQADTMWDDGEPGQFAHPAPTTPAAGDTNPALAMGPDGQPRLLWQRSVADGRKDLLLARGAYGAWQPATRVAAAVDISPSFPAVDVVATDARIFTTWTGTVDQSDGRVVVGSSSDDGASFALSSPPVLPDYQAGNSAVLQASASSVFAAFNTTDGGEPKGTNLATRLGSSPWSVSAPGAEVPSSIDSSGVAALLYNGGGRTTTLIYSGDRLYAASTA